MPRGKAGLYSGSNNCLKRKSTLTRLAIHESGRMWMMRLPSTTSTAHVINPASHRWHCSTQPQTKGVRVRVRVCVRVRVSSTASKQNQNQQWIEAEMERGEGPCPTLYVKKLSPMYEKTKFSARKLTSWKNCMVRCFDSSLRHGNV